MAIRKTTRKAKSVENAPDQKGGAPINAHSFDDLPGSAQRLWHAYIKAYKVVTDAVDRELKDRGVLSLAEYQVVSAVDSSGGRLRFIDIAKVTLLSQSRVSRQVDTLQHKGLLRREATDSDRRATFAMITPKGKTELARAAEVVVEALYHNFYNRLPEKKHGALQESLDYFLEADFRSQSARIINEARAANGLPPIVEG